MKKYLLAAVLSAMVLGAGVSAQAVTLWSGLSESSKAMGIYWPLGNSGLNVGTFAGLSFPSNSSVEYGVSGGALTLDGIPVAGGVELGVYFSKSNDKSAGFGYNIVLGKAYMFDLTDDVQIGFYLDLLNYGRGANSSDSTITVLGNLYPVLAAEVKLW